MIGPEDEQAKEGPGAFQDAVTAELSDADRQLYALFRVIRTARGSRSLALICLGGETVTVLEAGVSLETLQPLERWRCRLENEGVALEAEIRAVSPPIDFDGPATAPLAEAAGVHRYEQICGVAGELRTDDRQVTVEGVGRRAHAWGEPSGARFRSIFAVAAERAVIVSAVRLDDDAQLDRELVAAHLLRPESEPEAFETARLSTIYDSAGRPRSAGAELYLPGEEYPRRVSGEAVCQAVVEAESLQAASFRWSVEGDPAQGGYQMVSP